MFEVLAIVVLFALLVASAWLNVRLLRQNIMLQDQRESLVDTIEESLDELDTCYTHIAHAAEIPVMSDEPVIRGLVADIKRAKNAVLAIANNVVVYGEESKETDR